jgi:Phosphotransferase enzyme family
VVTEGLMNRNGRVTTVTGVWAVKQVLDVDAAAARRQHRATAGVAGLGLPVPAPVTAGDDSVVVVDGAVYAVLPWVDGVHRRGSAVAVVEASAFGELLAPAALGLRRGDATGPGPARRTGDRPGDRTRQDRPLPGP